MKKVFVFIAFVCALSLSINAQPAGYQLLSGDSKTAMTKKITSASSQLKTLKVNFTQEKTSKVFTSKVTSSGRMSYKKPSYLLWSYTSPTAYSIILNDKGAFFKNAKGSMKNKAIGELGGLLARTVGGDGLVSSSDFSVEYYQKSDIAVVMKPKVKKMQDMYSKIEVFLNPTTYLATKVKITEKNGDVTVINFSGHQKNVTIADSEFKE